MNPIKKHNIFTYSLSLQKTDSQWLSPGASQQKHWAYVEPPEEQEASHRLDSYRYRKSISWHIIYYRYLQCPVYFLDPDDFCDFPTSYSANIRLCFLLDINVII